jgi:hypothetical protein
MDLDQLKGQVKAIMLVVTAASGGSFKVRRLLELMSAQIPCVW